LVAGNFVFAIARLLDLAISLYVIVIIIRAILSWFNPDPRSSGMTFLMKITDPLLDRVRRILPLGTGVGLDLSPLIVIFGLLFVKYFLVASLYDLGAGLK
jgi:YggT family protein